MNIRKEICEELQSVLIKHPEFTDARILLNFHKPYLASEAWIISKNKIITEAYTATGMNKLEKDILKAIKQASNATEDIYFCLSNDVSDEEFDLALLRLWIDYQHTADVLWQLRKDRTKDTQ